MRYLVLVAILCSIAFAAPVIEPSPQVQLDLAVRGAESVTVVRAVTPSVETPESRLVSIHGRDQVEEVARLFGFTGEYAIAHREEKDGQEVYRIMNCLCLGDYSFSFSKDGREMVSITVHHWTHVRSTAIARGMDVKITKASADSIRRFVDTRGGSKNRKAG